MHFDGYCTRTAYSKVLLHVFSWWRTQGASWSKGIDVSWECCFSWTTPGILCFSAVGASSSIGPKQMIQGWTTLSRCATHPGSVFFVCFRRGWIFVLWWWDLCSLCLWFLFLWESHFRSQDGDCGKEHARASGNRPGTPGTTFFMLS